MNLAVRRIVNLEQEIRAGGDFFGRADGIDRGHVAGGVATQVGVAATVDAAAAATEQRAAVDQVNDDMVNHRAVARPGLGRLNPNIVLEQGWNANVDVVDRPLRGHHIRLGNLEDDVGRADRPPFRERFRSGNGFRVTKRRSLRDPRHEDRPLSRREAAVVLKMADSRVGMPRGHPPLVNNLTEHRGVLANVVVSQEWERANLTGTMTVLALLGDDRGDLTGISDRAELSLPRPRRWSGAPR